jgi:hypothetical protein
LVWIKTLGIDPFVLNLEEKMELASFAATELTKMQNVEIKDGWAVDVIAHIFGGLS